MSFNLRTNKRWSQAKIARKEEKAGDRIVITCKFADFDKARTGLFVPMRAVFLDKQKKGGELTVGDDFYFVPFLVKNPNRPLAFPFHTERMRKGGEGFLYFCEGFVV
jgi:hypothetical protein